MTNKYAEDLFKKILTKNTLCTLATASVDGKPEAATIEYVKDKDYNLYFETLVPNRKYPNMKSNPRASVVITEAPHTVQMDGTVEELSGKEAEEAKQRLIERHGEGSGFYSAPKIRFFRFTPKWIRVLVKYGYPPKYEVIKDE